MLRGPLLCTAEVKLQFRELAECFDSVIGRLICGFNDETPVHSTIWECWKHLRPYIQPAFDRIVQLITSVGLYEDRFALDTIHPECLCTDPDACGCGSQRPRVGLRLWIAHCSRLHQRFPCWRSRGSAQATPGNRGASIVLSIN